MSAHDYPQEPMFEWQILLIKEMRTIKPNHDDIWLH